MAVYWRVARPLWACSLPAIEWQLRVESDGNRGLVNGRKRRNLAVAVGSGDGPFTIWLQTFTIVRCEPAVW